MTHGQKRTRTILFISVLFINILHKRYDNESTGLTKLGISQIRFILSIRCHIR